MAKHIPYLDGWRGLAILSLLTGHFFPVNGINLGTAGVALFFVLSGLLMARILFIQQVRLTTFYQRRIARILPSVAVYLAVVSLLFVFTGREVPLIELLPAMTFTNNYIMPPKDAMPFGHIWSLSVEEHSYVILSIVAYWCRSRASRALAALGCLCCASVLAIAAYSLMPGSESMRFPLRTEVASFGILASAFVLVGMRSKRIQFSLPWVAPVALVVGVLCHWWSVPVAARVIIGWGSLALAVNTMHAASPIFLSVFKSVWLQKLGICSFSLYLWQQPYYLFVWRAGMSPWLGIVLALITGAIAYQFVERPARRYLNQRWTANAVTVTDEEIVKTQD
jgi:peptidoglycan/LPS O-acetylase OafA/YrhL